MKNSSELHNRATEVSLGLFFSNTGDPDWPDDPIGVLEGTVKLSDHQQMVTWEPFEYSYTDEQLLVHIQTLAQEIYDAMSWAQS